MRFNMRFNNDACPLYLIKLLLMWFMYTMEYYSAIRNDKYPPFALTWMELEGIMLSEKSIRERQLYGFTPMWNSERDHKGRGGN